MSNGCAVGRCRGSATLSPKIIASFLTQCQDSLGIGFPLLRERTGHGRISCFEFRLACLKNLRPGSDSVPANESVSIAISWNVSRRPDTGIGEVFAAVLNLLEIPLTRVVTCMRFPNNRHSLARIAIRRTIPVPISCFHEDPASSFRR